ncbi:MAG: HD domain-containing phosphohydrolase [Acidimicrobiales bacterium]
MAEGAEVKGMWAPKRCFAFTVRAVASILPFGLAFASGLVVSRLLPPPDGIVQRLLWWVLASAVAVVVLRAAERCARRLLPLSTLLSMTLVFPDHAPSRLRLALRANLKQRLREVEDAAKAGTAQACAEDLLAMVAALSRHDRRTVGHSERTRAYAALLADEVGLDPDESAKLQWAALLHDIGKLDVPASILNKPGRLDEAERAVIFGHPGAGEVRAAALIAWLGPWANGIWEHHEKFDGTGYPKGLRGSQITYAGRLVAVCDSFEVMAAARSYKKPMSLAEARTELVRSSGTHFDPQIVRAFLNISLGELRELAGPFAALAQLPYVAGWLSGAASSVAAAGVVAATMVMVAPASATQETPTVAATEAVATTTTAVTHPSTTTSTAASTTTPTTAPTTAPTTSVLVVTTVATTTAPTTAPPHKTPTTRPVTVVSPTSTPAPTTTVPTTAPAPTTAPPTTTPPTTTPPTTSPATTTATTIAAATQILVSLKDTRTSPAPANGASFSKGKDIFVFAIPPLGITSVTFYVDGAFVSDQPVAPYDMMGTRGDGKARPYKLPNTPGTIVVTVVTHFSGGGTQSASATISFS